MKKFIKKHRYTIILLLVFALLFVLGIKVKELLVPDEGKATYGERLKDINKYSISKETYTKIDEYYTSVDKVSKVTHRLQGKILNYFITLDDSVSPADAKKLAEKILEYFDEDTLKYYSIQIYLIKNDESLNNFPIIGMKDPLSNSISWSKDREIVKKDENEE